MFSPEHHVPLGTLARDRGAFFSAPYMACGQWIAYNRAMTNIIPFPEPVRVETMTLTLDEIFDFLLKRKSMEDLKRDKENSRRVETLLGMGIPKLRHMWDNLGDDDFYEGWDCAEIHTALNMLGDGHYCAV